jgi:allantoicase
MDQSPAFTHLIDLAAERFGGQVLWCTDDFFAEKENLIKPSKPIFIADKYTDRGKWMDGWESRRKRTEGHDQAVIQLGAAGVIKGFDVDTAHFLGNQPQYCTIEACYAPDGNWEGASWVEVLGKTLLDPGSQHFVEANVGVRARDLAPQLFTHVKLHIHPDGGVARLRVYGEVKRDWSTVKPNEVIDLASAQNGALSIQCNDMFFSHMNNLIMPGRGVNMGDGWETRRRREPGNDWVILALGCAGVVDRVLIDTAHFKGNFPDRASIQAVNLAGGSEHELAAQSLYWETLLPEVKLSMDAEHSFADELRALGPITHLRLNIFPDGGVSRLRLFGKPA